MNRYSDPRGMGASQDLRDAFDLIWLLVTEECVAGLHLHEAANHSCEDLRRRQLYAVSQEAENYYQRAKEILASNRSFFSELSRALSEKKLLTYREIKEIRGLTKQ